MYMHMHMYIATLYPFIMYIHLIFTMLHEPRQAHYYI